MSLLVPSCASGNGTQLSRTYYQVLDISPDEHDQKVIEEAALVCSGQVRSYQLKRESECTLRLKEIAEALITLLDPARRREYDLSLSNRSNPDVAERRSHPPPVTKVVPRDKSPPPALGEDALVLAIDERKSCDLTLMVRSVPRPRLM